ncbi:hypothetical protein PROFUN_14833 [Planoprotostelium fungivorum]|uniref:Uncharacterized protein n=1 Tax=Planoprotostelium fungivorum TaxID=1890364 RepID=A0A2P6MNG8_9EUKA|nr:hypothetical protein PROFUN_14833 [Planoprotostelium fungivorum]
MTRDRILSLNQTHDDPRASLFSIVFNRGLTIHEHEDPLTLKLVDASAAVLSSGLHCSSRSDLNNVSRQAIEARFKAEREVTDARLEARLEAEREATEAKIKKLSDQFRAFTASMMEAQVSNGKEEEEVNDQGKAEESEL